MKRILYIPALIIVFLGIRVVFWGSSQDTQEHKTLVENVEVNWWQVPIFAVDDDGNPVLDLQESDIEVFLNNWQVDTFNFYKCEFTVSSPKETPIGTRPEPKPEKLQPSPALKKNVIFLLFDVSMSTQVCTQRSKDVARQIVERTQGEVEFNVLTIEPFKGLKYICGPSLEKKTVLDAIEKKVIGKFNKRTIETEDISASSAKINPEAYYYLRKALTFFDAFKTLYLIFNSIQDNKFVYFFSEGISNSFLASLMGAKTQYHYELEKAVGLLNRSGAVIFIVNPMGVHDDAKLTTETKDVYEDVGGEPTSSFSEEKARSGEDFLRYMAEESGGKYLEGVEKQIVNALEQMHRAYYEISFPDLPGLKGTARDIVVRARRKGVNIHSLRSLEKSKRFKEMNQMEKEIAVLNTITLNPLLKTGLSVQHARVSAVKIHKEKVAFTVLLPREFLKQPLEIYKFRVKDNQEVVNLETSSLVPMQTKIQIEFAIKENQDPALKPYFALVDEKSETAVIRAIGDEWIDPEDSQKQAAYSNKEAMPPGDLQELLYHAAEYCEKIKQSAFHFFCKEKIVESQNFLVSRLDTPDISMVNMDRGVIRRPGMTGTNTMVNSYTFAYRLIKKGTEIKEERELLESKDNEPVIRDQVVKPTKFFSERAVFAPITLLAKERQDNYLFRFLGHDRFHKRKAAVIEAIPRNPGQEETIYGKIWIDCEDYSILKIEADPRSIIGYQALLAIEKKLDTRLFLSLDIEFNELYGGIRFPTRVQMLEKYKGGRLISIYSGPRGWERNRTIFTYSDYQFFAVDVEVSISENK